MLKNVITLLLPYAADKELHQNPELFGMHAHSELASANNLT